ncbi:DUF5954 family protein [Streptomyces sp. NPDC087300]|uniref:DUF5954 family protein n=1 Tax=Streptomyces sp. NPDC087300 TaxID=3365780 RepID=UPI00380854AA
MDPKHEKRAKPDDLGPVVVRIPQEPVEAAMEADAVDAIHTQDVVVRGPLFGVAAQDAADGPRWRVVASVRASFAQEARDSLNSLLWFRAKDDTEDRAQRRTLLAAVTRLENERVDELTVLGTRYRIVRAEEYAGTGPEGIEQPRPTDPEPVIPDWTRTSRGRALDADLILDPAAPLTPAQAMERLILRTMAYSGSQYPADVLHDSHRATITHPDVLLLPTTFLAVERTSTGWKRASDLHASAHDARKTLDNRLTHWQPRLRGLIPLHAPPDTDAHSLVAAGTATPGSELAAYAAASHRLRAGRINQIKVHNTLYRIARARRLLRWGPDGPEGPRPSDTDDHDPEPIHPTMDEHGTIHYADDGDDDEADSDDD